MDQARDVALAYLAALSAGDPDGVAALVTDDFHNEHTSALGAGSRGRDEYRARLPGFLAAFSDLRYEPREVVAEADRVVVAYRMTARHEGYQVDLPGVMWFEIAGGRIRRRTDYWDSLSFLRQTGGDRGTER